MQAYKATVCRLESAMVETDSEENASHSRYHGDCKKRVRIE